MNCLGRKILRAIQGQEIMAIQEHHRFQRLAALELPKDALKDRTEPLGETGARISCIWVSHGTRAIP